MRIVAVVVALGVGACSVNVAEPPSTPPRVPQVPLQPQTYQLANGMKVILVPDATADIASVLVRYQVGAIDEPAGQAGVAHVAAHVSYAPATGRLTLWDQLDRVGTWINTTPDASHTDFTVQCEPQHLAEILRLEAERLARRCDGVSDYWFQWLRTQVREEVRANATRLTSRTVSQAVYPASDPYRRAYDATPDSVDGITREQACAFIDQNYSPSNTVVVVSGPFESATFEPLIKRDLESVPSRPVRPRPQRAALGAQGSVAKVSADVAKPTLAIAWPLPLDEGDRTVTLLATELLAETLKSALFVEDNHVLLWMTDSDPVEAMIAKVRGALRTGLVAPTEFERKRSRRITELLGRLEAVRSRLQEVSRETILDEPFEALERINLQGFKAIVAKELDWSRARVIELQPDGTRPAWQSASLSDPAHRLIGPSYFPDAKAPPQPATDSRVIARARTFELANGLSVILVPTSPVPIVDIRLAFMAGVSAEPPTHRGTASIALAALEKVAGRGTHSAQSNWAVGAAYAGAGFDSSGIGVRGATMYADLLMHQFEGLADSQFQHTDIQKGHEALVRVATSPVHRIWDEQAAVRSTVFGPQHPYAQAGAPKPRDVNTFDSREVETFYRRYLQPNNATLIVTGGFDLDIVTALVHQTFDRWQGKGESVPARPPGGSAAMYASADQRRTVVLRAEWRAGPTDQSYEARAVVANMLNATSARIRTMHAARRQGGTYVIGGEFDPATAAAEIHDIQREIPMIGSGSDRYKAAFVAARRRAATASTGGGQSLGHWSAAILFAIENGHDVQWLGGMAKRFAAVTYDDVARLANSALTPERAVWFVSGPRDAVAAVYTQLGVEPTWLNR